MVCVCVCVCRFSSPSFSSDAAGPASDDTVDVWQVSVVPCAVPGAYLKEREINVDCSFPSISKIHYVHNLLNSIPFMLARRYVFPTCTAKPLCSLAMKERGMNGG